MKRENGSVKTWMRRMMATGALIAGVASGLGVTLGGSVLVSQTLPSTGVGEIAALPRAPGAGPDAYRTPPSPLDVRTAIRRASVLQATAIADSAKRLPEVPWGEWGLSHVEIRPDAIRWDEGRGAWIVRLEDGRTAVLTLDPELQNHVSKVLARYKEPGKAVVVIEPATGRVLAMADGGENASMGPGLARSSRAWSASVFKVVTGIALVAEGVATPETTTCFAGGWRSVEEPMLKLDPARDTSCITLTDAMGASANVVFARLAVDHLSPEVLQHWAERLGYNARIPFEMRTERSRAAIPTDDRLEFARAAAGFRHTWLSPLHGALMQAAIANRGVAMVPTLVDRIEDAEGNVVWRHAPVVWRRMMTEEVARTARDLQARTTTSGTAREHFLGRPLLAPPSRTWGKTGTLSSASAENPNPSPRLLFSWFTGGVERDGRQFAVAALVVNDEKWWIRGSFAAAEALTAAVR